MFEELFDGISFNYVRQLFIINRRLAMVDLNTPTGWKMSAVLLSEAWVDPEALPVLTEVFDEQEAAERRRDALKAEGWIATVTPQYPNAEQRKRQRRLDQQQIAPAGFCKEWVYYRADVGITVVGECDRE
jgi:hypothetical protein